MMKISFIVPVYKVENYIWECLQSLSEQRGSDLEFIIIDDGSPDNSGAIIDDFVGKDSRFKVIHKENEGVSVARNVGIDEAHGEWICFVDGDDKIENNTVSILRQYIDKVESDIIVFSHKNFDGQNIPEMEQDGDTELFDLACIEKIRLDCLVHDRTTSRYFFYDFGYPWGKLYRADLLKKNKLYFPKGIKKHQDQLFNLKVLKFVDSIFGIHCNLYCYRANQNSISNSDLSVLIEAYDKKINAQLNIIKEYYADDYKLLERHNISCFCTLMLVADRILNFKERLKYLKDHLDMPLYKDALNIPNKFLSKKQLLCKYLLKIGAYRTASKILQIR